MMKLTFHMVDENQISLCGNDWSLGFQAYLDLVHLSFRTHLNTYTLGIL